MGLQLALLVAQWLVHWDAVLGTPGSKTPIQVNCSGSGSFSLPLQPYDDGHSLKKPHETGQVR